MNTQAKQPETGYQGYLGVHDRMKRKRKIADSMAWGLGRTPKNVGEGLHALGTGLMVRGLNRQADKLAAQYHSAIAAGAKPIGGVPTYRNGTGFHPGGPAIVGEEGPEMVNLPRGSQVLPTGPTNAIKGIAQTIMANNDGQQEHSKIRHMIAQALTDEDLGPAPANPQNGAGIDINGNPMFRAAQGQLQLPSRFDDANSYQVAQASGGVISDAPPLLYEPQETINPAATANNSIQGAVLNNRRGIARLARVDSMLQENPDLLNDSNSFRGDMRRKGLEWRDYLAPDSMTDEGKDYLANVSKFRLNVMQHVNLGIKEMTGAQMSETEAKRLMAAMPNQNDSPTVFKAKLDEAMHLMRMANARETYWAQRGIPGAAWDQVPLTDMQAILSQRGSEIYQDLISQGVEGGAARQQAAQMLAQEFGL